MGTDENVESAYIVVSTRSDASADVDEVKYLFLERVDCGVYPAGIFDLPGGGRDDSESALSCALRELYEETGINGEFDHLHECARFQTRRGNFIVYYALEVNSLSAIKVSQEHRAARFLSVVEIQQMHYEKRIVTVHGDIVLTRIEGTEYPGRDNDLEANVNQEGSSLTYRYK